MIICLFLRYKNEIEGAEMYRDPNMSLTLKLLLLALVPGILCISQLVHDAPEGIANVPVGISGIRECQSATIGNVFRSTNS